LENRRNTDEHRDRQSEKYTKQRIQTEQEADRARHRLNKTQTEQDTD